MPQLLPFGRLEKRIPAVFPVYLTSDTHQVLAETAYTENVSAHGARILTQRKWAPDDRLQIESVRWSFRSTARVAYCDPLQDDEFAVGLEFLDHAITAIGPHE
jgi:hypothetical protein